MTCKCQCQCAQPKRSQTAAWPWYLGVSVFIVLWFALYSQLLPIARWIVGQLPLVPQSHLAEAVEFFLYDTPKVLMLLVLVVFLMGVVRSFFPPQRVQALLSGRREGVGNIMASCLGIVTPFCTCSAVPMFVGFVSAGVPLGATFSFLIAAPLINEVAIGLLLGLAGWKVAMAYLVFGFFIAVLSGFVLGRLRLEGWLEKWVQEARRAEIVEADRSLTGVDRIRAGIEAVRDILSKIWVWVLLGISVGALIHGYVPTELLASLMGNQNIWSIPAVVVLGVPMYANAAGMIPIVEALLAKGAALGTVLSFMMAVTALSLPEILILRKVLSMKLIAVFLAVVTTGILVVGYLFNALFVA